MNLLSFENISKSYNEKVLFSGISLGIGEGDKIGVIGINGVGKSTLLKILAGVETPDNGKVTTINGLTIQYLPQNPEFKKNATVLQQIFRGNSEVMELVREYEAVLKRLEQTPGEASLEKKVIELNPKMDALNAWQLESDAKTILTKLGIYDFDAKVDTLSGGQRKRVAMAAALISPADLIILDEPTNHIDNQAVEWLEEYLGRRKGALLMVTHDRYFLDRVVNKTLELDNKKLYMYQGNYSSFLEKKLEREEEERAAERKRQNLLRYELEWIRRGARARSTKQKARIERFEELKGANPEFICDNIEIAAVSSRLGRKVIELSGIFKSFEDKQLISGFDYTFLQDDRVGIIGPNGIGKSTLLKIAAGRLEPDRGSVERGKTVKTAFFAQENEGMDENLRVIEYIREAAEYLETEEGTISASQMLERFLFPPVVQWTIIKKLSGGEKRRLFLLRCLMTAPNVLLLDEPTNDLDIQTLTILENYLDSYNGAVMVVSHDRYFLDRVVKKIFAFEGNGNIRKITGNYSDYCKHVEERVPEDDEQGIKKGKKERITEPQKKRPLKLSYKEQKEYEEIDGVIEELENELKQIAARIEEASSDYTLLQELTALQQTMEKRLEEKVDRWVYLNELQQEIAHSKKKVPGDGFE